MRDLTVSAAMRDGSRIWLSLNYQPFTGPGNGAVEGLVVSMRRHTAMGLSGSRPSHTSTPAADDPLTNRERAVISLIALGADTRQIAQELHISPDTVRTHVRNAMSKLGAHSRAQLVALTLSSESMPRVDGGRL